ncbi:MAG TPA: integrase arm-type DNA-binding domain-containing protein [Hyphomicrobiaceae bacterium]|nr:integrase arm-type DNA-binding domain-containing protein [Hyphomicrobiaceae bacterium]
MAEGKLTALKVAKLTKVGRYGDGGGLYLQVSTFGTKAWVFRFQIGGKPRTMGLGPLDTVSLAEARTRARQARQAILDGVDPIAHKQAQRAAVMVEAAKAVTFQECAEAYIAEHSKRWKNEKHIAQWRSTLAKANEKFGRLPVGAVDEGLILQVLRHKEPGEALTFWDKTPETASRLRGRIESVLDYATASKYRQGDNPARWKGNLEHLLAAKPKGDHHTALPFEALPAFMAELRARDSESARALEFTILTAARTGEVIGARWDEVDLKGKVWRIPAARMKAGKDHEVPLSDRALEVLGKPGKGFLFGSGAALSNMAMLQLLKGMRPGLTVHGFRSTFRDWAGDRTGYARDVIEHALAHKLPDKVEAAYRRSTALDKRARLMAEWSSYAASTPVEAGNVVSLRA